MTDARILEIFWDFSGNEKDDCKEPNPIQIYSCVLPLEMI